MIKYHGFFDAGDTLLCLFSLVFCLLRIHIVLHAEKESWKYGTSGWETLKNLFKITSSCWWSSDYCNSQCCRLVELKTHYNWHPMCRRSCNSSNCPQCYYCKLAVAAAVVHHSWLLVGDECQYCSNSNSSMCLQPALMSLPLLIFPSSLYLLLAFVVFVDVSAWLLKSFATFSTMTFSLSLTLMFLKISRVFCCCYWLLS